ncbi:hypothetical protein PGTUg99_000202 [Puccinia graminis f. sp. tritici]|uniref:Uncharacterized protein n=1 Tax=Puccinia graminis f. sp. tritici TaxID=56615 RepID=A0A5B0SJ61_PUCGR|nr:hypothetical protein PGTUg99_000202 [Puccinia graminis f. sp. tritici]
MQWRIGSIDFNKSLMPVLKKAGIVVKNDLMMTPKLSICRLMTTILLISKLLGLRPRSKPVKGLSTCKSMTANLKPISSGRR